MRAGTGTSRRCLPQPFILFKMFYILLISVCVCVEMCFDELGTEVLLLGVGVFDQAEEQLGEVADDDEGWG